MLSNMLAQQGRTPEAVVVLDRLAQSLPPGQKRQDALFRAAYLTYDGKNYGAAKKRFAHFVGMNPRAKAADEALWFMGWCGFHLKQYEAALVDFGRLRRLYPQSSMVPRAEYWSARILAMRRRDGEAQRLWQKLSVRPGYYGMLARQLRAQGPSSTVASGEGMRPSTTLSLLGGKVAPADGLAAAVPPGPSSPSDTLLLGQLPDEEMLGFVLAQGTQVLDWSGPPGVRVSTLISLGLKDEAAVWVNAVRGLPGVPARAQALGRAQILYALGNYTLAMRQVTPLLPAEVHADPDPAEQMALRLAYPPAFAPWVMEAARAFDVSELLLLALMRQESAFNVRASSQVSAKGLMQIMPVTGRRIAQKLGLKDYTDAQLLAPKLNIYLAGWYMGALLQRFGGNLPVAIGSYNAGPHASERWIQGAQDSPTDVFVEDIPYRETRDYIKKVLANLEMYGRLYGADIEPWPHTVRASAPGGVDF
jgi:soluble lytic murein transglycosylase